jgi:transposase
LRARTENARRLERTTNGAGRAGEDAAGRDGQRGVAVLGFGAGGRAAGAGVPDPELVEQAKRGKFTARYKLEILEQAEACTEPGQIGELLRREGLYPSHLTYWRKQRKAGALRELGRPRGRKPADRRDEEIAELRRRAERAEAELQKARKVIEIQGNVSALLEQMLGTEGDSGSTER